MPRQLNEQKYCGWCAAEVRYFAEWASECTGCGFKRFFNPNPCSNVIVTNGDAVLMVQRSINPSKGQFDLPGGYMDMQDENMENASLRELSEEVGLTADDITELRYLGSLKSPTYIWQDTAIKNISFYYVAQLKNADKELALDLSENQSYKWVTKDDIESIDFAWDIDKIMLNKYFEEKL